MRWCPVAFCLKLTILTVSLQRNLQVSYIHNIFVWKLFCSFSVALFILSWWIIESRRVHNLQPFNPHFSWPKRTNFYFLGAFCAGDETGPHHCIYRKRHTCNGVPDGVLKPELWDWWLLLTSLQLLRCLHRQQSVIEMLLLCQDISIQQAVRSSSTVVGCKSLLIL